MYGFSIYNKISPFEDTSKRIEWQNYTCVNNMIEKFKEDKLFFETENYIIILDGLIINKKELKKGNSWKDTIVSLYEEKGETFFNSMRGCFAGAVYDKKKDKWIIFSDQLGQKYIYYYVDENVLVCSSMIDNVYNTLRKNGINYSLSEESAMMLLTFGNVFQDRTLSNEVKKVQPGSYIVYENKVLVERKYYTLSNTPNYERNIDETIEELDRLFRQAVKRQFDKDLEYNYEHICALSAGLDCRMTTFVAHDLGYTNQTNLTFSQSDYWDEIIPKRMARDLHHEWVFKSLDDGMWLLNADEITKITGGNVFYRGSAHGDSLFRKINWEKYGMIHSGQMGDVTIGCIPCSNDEPYEVGDGAFFRTYLDDLKGVLSGGLSYPNREIGLWYCRYLNGTNYGQQNEYNYTETFSPFTDLDFIEFCLSIPCKLRHNHKVYKKWIINKYPQAANYEWEKIGAKITDPTISIMGKDIPLKSVPYKAVREFKKRTGIGNLDTKQNMQPVGYYIDTIDSVREYLNGFSVYSKYIKSDRILSIIDDIMKRGRGEQKLQAVSLLSAIKVYFK